MKWLSTTYRMGFFLLLAALIIFLFGETFASAFGNAPTNSGRGERGEDSSWLSAIMYFAAGTGSAFLLLAGAVEAVCAKHWVKAGSTGS